MACRSFKQNRHVLSGQVRDAQVRLNGFDMNRVKFRGQEPSPNNPIIHLSRPTGLLGVLEGNFGGCSIVKRLNNIYI